MNEASSIRARRFERGEVSWVGLVLLLGLAAAVYLAWVWVPVYLRTQQVDEVVRVAMNTAVKTPDDAAIVADLVRRVRALETVPVEGPDGRVEQVPRIDLSPSDVTWERDTARRTLRVAFTYAIDVEYPWIHRVAPYTVEVDHTADISIPRWEGK